MKKPTAAKLRLATQTLRTLASSRLTTAAGGGIGTVEPLTTCTAPCTETFVSCLRKGPNLQ